MKKILVLAILLFNPLIAKDTIQIYHCYGNDTQLITEGRIVDQRILHESSQNDNIFINLKRKLGQLINKEKKFTPVTLKVDSKTFQTTTDDEGYFDFSLSFPPKTLQPGEPITLYLTRQPGVKASCRAFILTDTKQTGIISDFDDTVIISNVTRKLNFLNQLLLKNYKQREAVPGMAKRFKMILQNSPDKPLFFITGSPKQLTYTIHRFLDYHHFPKRTLITKKVHGKNAYPLFKQHGYKTLQIERIIKLYPNINWVLFGDSGEEDTKIYLDIARKYPAHIKEIYIRDIKNGEIKKIYPNNTLSLIVRNQRSFLNSVLIDHETNQCTVAF